MLIVGDSVNRQFATELAWLLGGEKSRPQPKPAEWSPPAWLDFRMRMSRPGSPTSQHWRPIDGTFRTHCNYTEMYRLGHHPWENFFCDPWADAERIAAEFSTILLNTGAHGTPDNECPTRGGRDE
eukprot:gene43954-28939_t